MTAPIHRRPVGGGEYMLTGRFADPGFSYPHTTVSISLCRRDHKTGKKAGPSLMRLRVPAADAQLGAEILEWWASVARKWRWPDRTEYSLGYDWSLTITKAGRALQAEMEGGR